MIQSLTGLLFDLAFIDCIILQSLQPPWYTLGNANAGGTVTFKYYNSKTTNKKIFSYSVLESSHHPLDSGIKSGYSI